MRLHLERIEEIKPEKLLNLLEICLRLRMEDPSLKLTNAFRLFNGFYEGFPGLTIDFYAQTLLITEHDTRRATQPGLHDDIARFYVENLPELNGVLLKRRASKAAGERKGIMIFGERPSTSVAENGVNYALDLQLNQDASFYPDTRNLRLWLHQNLSGASVLNCFAYTGSLGIAALAGGAREVLQTDLNPHFLALAARSQALNSFTGTMKTRSQDFYPMIAGFKSQSRLLDAVILDAPLFSQTRRGKVDLLQNWHRLVNKARPLIAHKGCLVAINNALFLPGESLMDSVRELTADGYLEVIEQIPIPPDVTGYAQSVKTKAPADPAPFNHPTKILILRAYRKDGRRA